MRDLSKIVKAYDIRGVVPDELDAEVAGAVGAAVLARRPPLFSTAERHDKQHENDAEQQTEDQPGQG